MMEWSGVSIRAEYVTEPGEVEDDFGNRNDGRALVITSDGENGVTVEADTPAELIGWLEAAIKLIRDTERG